MDKLLRYPNGFPKEMEAHVTLADDWIGRQTGVKIRMNDRVSSFGTWLLAQGIHHDRTHNAVALQFNTSSGWRYFYLEFENTSKWYGIRFYETLTLCSLYKVSSLPAPYITAVNVGETYIKIYHTAYTLAHETKPSFQIESTSTATPSPLPPPLPPLVKKIKSSGSKDISKFFKK